jgi:tellurite resistance protein TerC
LKILWTKDEDEKMDIEKHPMVRVGFEIFFKFPEYVKGKFFHKENGIKHLRLLFLVLLSG